MYKTLKSNCTTKYTEFHTLALEETPKALAFFGSALGSTVLETESSTGALRKKHVLLR